MKKLKFAIIVSAIVLTVSCKSDLKPQDSSDTETVVSAKEEVSATNPAQTITTSDAQAMPQQNAVAQTAPGMNPPHGEPGHKCEIAVGAPLNSAATTATKPQVGQVQPASPMNVTTSATPQKVAKGMNPAHGQPGHRCDIAVGQPLSSAPANTKPAPTPITAPIVQTSSAPALLTPNANQAVAAGMNPPHGQDGHRCDIAVGAALPKS